jgi:hypothetical protein
MMLDDAGLPWTLVKNRQRLHPARRISYHLLGWIFLDLVGLTWIPLDFHIQNPPFCIKVSRIQYPASHSRKIFWFDSL